MPRITVTMPTRNRANLIGRAIRSLGRQTFRDFELLVGDDGCTDETLDVVEREAKTAGVASRTINGGGKRVGLPSMRNRLIRESDSEFIAVLDDDDEAFPDRLAIGVRMMEADPGLAVAGGAALQRDGTGRKTILKPPRSDIGIRRLALSTYPFRNTSVMMRRSCLPSQEPYDETMAWGEDTLLWAQMTKREGIRFKNTWRIIVTKHTHGQQQQIQMRTEERQTWKGVVQARLAKLNAAFLAARGAPKDAEVAGWLATPAWWSVEPDSIPDPDRVSAVYAGLDRWGQRIAGPGLARAIERKTPWHGRPSLRGPLPLSGLVLASRATRIALTSCRRLSLGPPGRQPPRTR